MTEVYKPECSSGWKGQGSAVAELLPLGECKTDGDDVACYASSNGRPRLGKAVAYMGSEYIAFAVSMDASLPICCFSAVALQLPSLVE